MFKDLYKELLAAKVPEEAVTAISSSIAPLSRDGDPAFVVFPVLDEPSSLRFAGREIEIDLGLTVYILPIRWDGCLAGVPNLTAFCRRRISVNDGDKPVWSLTPLWDGSPTPGSFRRAVEAWSWSASGWSKGSSGLGSIPTNPFTREIRYRNPQEQNPLGHRAPDRWYPLPELSPKR